MASGPQSIDVDVEALRDTINEVVALAGDWRTVPEHLRARVKALARLEQLTVEEARPYVEIDMTATPPRVLPGPELLAVLGTLRAIRGSPCSIGA